MTQSDMKNNLSKQKVEYQIQRFDGLVLCYYFKFLLFRIKFSLLLSWLVQNLKVNKACLHQHWLQVQCLSIKLDLFKFNLNKAEKM